MSTPIADGPADRWRAAWLELDLRLRRFLLANLIGLVSAIVVLGVMVLTVVSSGSMLADLGVMTAAVLVLLGAVPFLPRGGAPVAIFAVIISTLIFAVGATFVSPFLAPLTVLVQLVPVMVAYPYLGKRAMRVATAIAVVVSGALAAIGEYRRPHVDPIATEMAVLSLVVFIPFVIVVIAFSVNQTYRQLSQTAVELHESRTQVAAVADAARRGLERDLHDGAQQRLVGMSVRITRAQELLAAGREVDARAALAELADQNRLAIRELRELAQGIYPPLLAERGLGPALNAAARRSVLPCTVSVDPVLTRATPSVESAVYFCILEALQNAAKHSGASEVEVRVQAAPLRFEVLDQGVGFDPRAVESSGGILGMTARVRAAGGELDVRSAAGEGTRVSGRFPLG